MVQFALRSGLSKHLHKRPSADMTREMTYIDLRSSKNLQEKDALMRFYAMLSVIVTSKGRPSTQIEDKKLDILIKQPLEGAFSKLFQALLLFPSNRSLKSLISYTCRQILYEQVEDLKITMGVITEKLSDRKSSASRSDHILEKMKESRIVIHEDTISRLFHMLEFYVPLNMRPKIWDEREITPAQWSNITKPISEAFATFLNLMRCYPRGITYQKQLTQFTIDTILCNCEIAMKLRGITFELSENRSVAQKVRRAKSRESACHYDQTLGVQEPIQGRDSAATPESASIESIDSSMISNTSDIKPERSQISPTQSYRREATRITAEFKSDIQPSPRINYSMLPVPVRPLPDTHCIRRNVRSADVTCRRHIYHREQERRPRPKSHSLSSSRNSSIGYRSLEF